MRQDNVVAIPVQNVASSISSNAIPALNLFACSVQAVATGASVAGTVKIQASNDVPQAANAVPTDWNDIASATVSISGPGAFLIPYTDLCYQFIRIVYTNSGSGGTIAVRVKGLGE